VVSTKESIEENLEFGGSWKEIETFLFAEFQFFLVVIVRVI
jgi:hypothetical protein